MLPLQSVHENRDSCATSSYSRADTISCARSVTAVQRYENVLKFKQQSPSQTWQRRVIGRDATNWYRGMILNEGESERVKLKWAWSLLPVWLAVW